MYNSQKKFINSIVGESIDRLLSEGKKNHKKHPERSKRYMELVWKFVKRYKYPLPKEKRLMFCKKCFAYWAKNTTLGINNDKKNKIIEYKCLNCGYCKLIPYYQK